MDGVGTPPTALEFDRETILRQKGKNPAVGIIDLLGGDTTAVSIADGLPLDNPIVDLSG